VSIGCALPATLTFTYPTVHALAEFLLNQVLNLPGTSSAGLRARDESIELTAPDEALAYLSDDEIKNLLSTELSSLSEELRR
jgi:hypothetical protein